MNYATEFKPTLHACGVHWSIIGEHSHTATGARLAFLRVTPVAVDVCEARASEWLSVEETGVVALARVRNDGPAPVLVPADLVLRGGYQTRVVERGVVIAAGATADIPVRCVEQGRWRAEDPQPARLRVAETTDTRTRMTFLREKTGAFREQRGYALAQNRVWEHVDRELSRARIASPTRSYGALLDTRPHRAASSARHAPPVPPDANAVAVTHGEGGGWLEVFLSNDALAEALPKVLDDVTELASARALRTMRPMRPMHVAPSWTPGALVEWLWRAPLGSVPPVEGTIGSTLVVGAPGLVGEVVLLGPALVHAVATVAHD